MNHEPLKICMYFRFITLYLNLILRYLEIRCKSSAILKSFQFGFKFVVYKSHIIALPLNQPGTLNHHLEDIMKNRNRSKQYIIKNKKSPIATVHQGARNENLIRECCATMIGGCSSVLFRGAAARARVAAMCARSR